MAKSCRSQKSIEGDDKIKKSRKHHKRNRIEENSLFLQFRLKDMDNIKQLQFNVSARTAKLIGLENFANAEGAIIELVKNAYDADSDICAVIFDIKDERKDSAIYIIDTGVGMNDV